MAVEAAQAGSPESTIKAIAQQAHNEIDGVSDELRQSEQPLEKALTNLQLIGRLSQLPGVRSYLQVTEKEIVIFGEGISGSRVSLILSKDGMKLQYWAQVDPPEGWTVKERTYNSVLWERRFTASKEELEGLCADQCHMGKHTLRKLANLKPETIVKKFERAVSSPIEVS